MGDREVSNKEAYRLIAQILRSHLVKIVFLVLIAVCMGVCPCIDGILLKTIINSVESASSGEVVSTIFPLMFVYAIWWEVINVMYRVYDFVYMKTMPQIKGSVVDMFYAHVQYHSQTFFQQNMPGNISNRITEAAKSLEMILSTLNEKIIRKCAVIFATIATMYLINPMFALVFVAWLIVFCSISFFASIKIGRFSKQFARERGIIGGRIVDAISNVSVIRIFYSYAFERNYLRKYIHKTITSETKMQFFMLKIRFLLGVSCSLMIFAIVYLLAYFYSQSKITIGDFALVLSMCVAIGDDIWDLGQEIGDLFEEMGSFKQSMYMFVQHEIADSPNAKDLIVKTGKVEFKNVVFRYRNQQILFRNKSIVIEGKTRVGLVGFSGSGKSTFVNLISRIHEIESGAILIDEQNIAQVTKRSLSRVVTFIPQEPLLFQRSVRENISYGTFDANDDQIVHAAKAAHIHDIIMQMPNGYDTICSARGSMSGGQKQRIVIARAILADSPIVILDEATSNLDLITESLIQQSLQNLTRNKTVLVVAHRLQTLLDMDAILVFDHGQIVQHGTHQELIEQQGGLYKKLWDSQGFI